jgi:hypothetical protein
MKHLLFILSLLVIGCSPKSGVEQMLELKDGRRIPCRLLSVRSESVVVDTSNPLAINLAGSKPTLIRFSELHRYHYDPVSASRTMLITSLGGLAVGAVVAGVRDDGSDSVSVVPISRAGEAVLSGFAIGLATGILINELAYSTYDPSDPKDREEMASRAIYKTEEPDELKKIK